jgi:hypothetical protein
MSGSNYPSIIEDYRDLSEPGCNIEEENITIILDLE